MFKVSPASLQTSFDTPKCVLEDRVQYGTVHIPNVFCDGHLQIISFLYCNRQVHRDFLITLYIITPTVIILLTAISHFRLNYRLMNCTAINFNCRLNDIKRA